MEITISVKRQHSASEKAYIQTFHYSGNGKLSGRLADRSKSGRGK